MYQLNETAARASEQRSERIVEPGEYIGILTCAEDITSKRGARGIDCVFETENYYKPDGTPVVKAVPAHFFQADTGLMASELLDGKVQPQQKEKLIKRLRHRPAKEG